MDDKIGDYYDDITDAQLELDDYYDQLEEAQEAAANLVVYAPFSGRLVSLDVEADRRRYERHPPCNARGRLHAHPIEYFSYAYESDVSVGMRQRSLWLDAMLELDATVTKIDKVDYCHLRRYALASP